MGAEILARASRICLNPAFAVRLVAGSDSGAVVLLVASEVNHMRCLREFASSLAENAYMRVPGWLLRAASRYTADSFTMSQRRLEFWLTRMIELQGDPPPLKRLKGQGRPGKPCSSKIMRSIWLLGSYAEATKRVSSNSPITARTWLAPGMDHDSWP